MDGICSHRAKFQKSGILGFVVTIVVVVIACHAICDGLTFLTPVYPMGLKESTSKVGVSIAEGFI